jgi:hypothetical protein
MPAFYKIRVKGQLDPCWSEWLEGLTIDCLESGETQLSGQRANQCALFGILNWIRDMNLELVFLKKEEK